MELVAAGFAVSMLGSRQRYDDARADLPARAVWEGVDILRVGTPRFGRAQLVGRLIDYLGFYVAAGWALVRHVRRGDVVVAKTDPPLLSVVAAFAARVRGARLVNWLQDVFPDVALALGEPRIPRVLARAVTMLRDASLRRAALNVVIGERMAERVRTHAGSAPVVVVPNWAHEAAVQPMAQADSRMRSELGLQHSFVVGYSGNLGRAHDWQTLFDAAMHLQDDPRVRFLVVGDGAGYRALRDRVARAGLSSVVFQPYQPLDRLADAMAAADVHLVSLRPMLEGLIVPSKFFGVLAAARPVVFIGDASGELGPVIRESDCGVVIAEGDGAALAMALRAYADDPKRCTASGVRGHELLRARYARTVAIRAWIDHLEHLVA